MSNAVVAGLKVETGSLVDGKPDANGKTLKVIECKVDDKAYAAGLEAAGLSMKTVKEVVNYNESYIKSIATDAADAGTNILKENKDADRVIFVAPYLTDAPNSRSSHIDIVIDRAKDINIPGKGIEVRPYMGIQVVNKSEKLGKHLKDLRDGLLENIK